MTFETSVCGTIVLRLFQKIDMRIGLPGKIATAVLPLLISTSSFAQGGFDIGIRYMVEKSMLLNKSDNNQGGELEMDNTISYLNGGLAVGYNFGTKIGVEIDVLSSRQGQIYTGTDPQPNTNAYTREVVYQALFNNQVLVGDYQAKAELNVVKVPLLLRLSTSKAQPLSFHLLVGPQINVISNVVYELNHNDIDLPGTNIAPNDAYRRVTVDGVVSPGINFKIAKRCWLTGDVRFDYGFEDAEQKNIIFSYMGGPNENYYSPDRAATHNMTIGVMVGASYKL